MRVKHHFSTTSSVSQPNILMILIFLLLQSFPSHSSLRSHHHSYTCVGCRCILSFYPHKSYKTSTGSWNGNSWKKLDGINFCSSCLSKRAYKFSLLYLTSTLIEVYSFIFLEHHRPILNLLLFSYSVEFSLLYCVIESCWIQEQIVMLIKRIFHPFTWSDLSKGSLH